MLSSMSRTFDIATHDRPSPLPALDRRVGGSREMGR